jgi:hypothetical protein
MDSSLLLYLGTRIAGQEHVNRVALGDLADTTISSDDEEGIDIPGFNDEQDDNDLASDTSVNVSKQEKDL